MLNGRISAIEHLKNARSRSGRFFPLRERFRGVEPNTDTTQKLDEKEFGEPL